MPVYKDKNGTWYVMTRCDDWQGQRKQKCKRGFKTKREAQDWERRFLLQQGGDLDMLFKDFYKLYEQDMKARLKQNTWEHKACVIKSKILPYFGEKSMKDIQARDVLTWQNELLRHRDKNGKPYSETYLKNLHNQLSCIFNHAVRYYDLSTNPAAKAGSIGVKNAKEMNFWTKDEYMQFSEVMMDKPISFYAFEMLYWCGIRLVELLALTTEDFDFKNRKLRINKSYQRIKGQDVITEPKTKKSNRTIEMPDFLCEEMQEYFSMLYDQKPDERIFPISKSYLHHEMDRGVKATGLKRIRIHDLRHSHVSLLIELGFSAVAIADRVGHESIEITYRYAHLFPSKQTEMANRLGELKKGGDFNVNKES